MPEELEGFESHESLESPKSPEQPKEPESPKRPKEPEEPVEPMELKSPESHQSPANPSDAVESIASLCTDDCNVCINRNLIELITDIAGRVRGNSKLVQHLEVINTMTRPVYVNVYKSDPPTDSDLFQDD